MCAMGCIKTKSPPAMFLVARVKQTEASLSRQSIVSLLHMTVLSPSTRAALTVSSLYAPEGGAKSVA